MKQVSCGADTPVREMSEPGMAKARAHEIFASIVRPFAVLRAALQEIFDESAYQRFLDRYHLPSSVHTYALFQQENEQTKSRRPRCC